MELTLHVENQGSIETGENIHGALHTIGENAVHINQAPARLESKNL